MVPIVAVLTLFQVVVERLDRVEVFVGVAEEDALFSGHGSWRM